ncbi:MAG: putative ssRNA endonuclease [Euryarchaeota archaeon ADurb.Bin294]|jgi:CRISPR-associated protein Cas2|nr:type I-E CRISPR-associated endoribonuclease Cas2 [Methanomicrobiales archaeon]OQA55653.1 MAG: putative ssRNA endonuclease [Euryarchaeota archaeon ADurb.Bin294]
MMVVVTEGIPPSLRGRLAVWLLEVRSGVYVGSYSVRVKEMIWNQVCQGVGIGNAVMMWRTPTEAGFNFLTVGHNRRIPIDADGFPLVAFMPEEKKKK